MLAAAARPDRGPRLGADRAVGARAPAALPAAGHHRRAAAAAGRAPAGAPGDRRVRAQPRAAPRRLPRAPSPTRVARRATPAHGRAARRGGRPAAAAPTCAPWPTGRRAGWRSTCARSRPRIARPTLVVVGHPRPRDPAARRALAGRAPCPRGACCALAGRRALPPPRGARRGAAAPIVGHLDVSDELLDAGPRARRAPPATLLLERVGRAGQRRRVQDQPHRPGQRRRPRRPRR